MAGTRLIQSVQHALEVLWAFNTTTPVWGVNELARHLGLHKSTVSRLLATLERKQVVHREPGSERYRLGVGVLELAGTLLDQLDIDEVARPHMVALAAASRETVNLATWQ